MFRNFLSNSDLEKIEDKIRQPKWSCSHSSIPGTGLFWQMDGLEGDEFFAIHLLNKIKEVTSDEFTVERIYLNGHNACSQGYPHTDTNQENGRTFLIYCNSVWDLSLGGSTSFLIDNEVKSFFPYPKSGLYFKNNIVHMASPISKDFKGIRVTLAFKLYKV